jgi:hypothetical protein
MFKTNSNTGRQALLLTAIVLAATLLLAGGALADEGWGPAWNALPPTNVSQSGAIRQPALIIGPDEQVTVAWAGGDALGAPNGIYLVTEPEAASPTVHAIAETGTEDAWAPSLAYNGTQLMATWVQGDASNLSSPIGAVKQLDPGSGQAVQEIMGPVYGHTAPRLAMRPTGGHLIFASGPSENEFSRGEIYYAHRPTGATSWTSPTKVITHSQASAPRGGGIWYPDMALDADGSTIHVVWEQTIGFGRSVWHVQGTWDSGAQEFTWGAPTRLSVSGKTAVRPKVTVDGSGNAHVTWVEQDVVSLTPEITLQYVNYRRLEGGGWLPPLADESLTLDDTPVQVNTYRPTWSTLSMSAYGRRVCVAWHGYRGDPGATGEEEILLNCSPDGGDTWLPRVVNISETSHALSLFPAIALYDADTLHTAWEEHQGGNDFTTNYDVFYRQGPAPDPRYEINLPLIMRSYP